MAEFEELQKELSGARANVQAHKQAIARERRQIDRLQRDRLNVERRVRGTSTAPPEALESIDAQLRERKAAVASLRGDLAKASKFEEGLLGQFVDFSDPREHIGRLSDRTPILLTPLRIETRFKTAKETGNDTDELWIRVYPDDFSIDSFEETLTETEARDTRSYWAEIWRAGGDEGGERGAWKVLLAGQGSGRSYWVVNNYQPLNPSDKPVPPDDSPWIILTITTRAPLAEPELTTVRSYWTDLWRAGEDIALQNAANDALIAALGAERASQISTDYRPDNLNDPPPASATRQDTEVLVSFLHFPSDEDADLRQYGWSATPQATTLPDRLVVLGYNNNELTLQKLGEAIPAELAVAPDPSADEQDQIQPDGANLKVGPEMAWLTDFNRAIAVGMGFRIPLTALEFRQGFDQLMVLGVRLKADAQANKAALEELISHHHSSKAGFSILPQGQPTNNVDTEDSAYSWREDSEISFDHYFKEAAPEPTDWLEKGDGRRLAETLGLDPAVLNAIPHYQRTDIGDARAMNVALWPATLGYFMESMLHPIFDDTSIEQTREFFTRHVSARGCIPAIRVGKQPYGILPVSPRSRLRWMLPRRDEIEVRASASLPRSNFLQRLYGLLRKVESDFEPLLDRVSYIGKPGGDQHQILLDVIGLHSGSVEFQQRYAESLQQLYNRLSMQGAGGQFLALIITLGYAASGLNLLGDLGYQADPEAETPDILEKFFVRKPNHLRGGLIDDQPLSEVSPIRAYTETGDNYIKWLIDAATTSHDTLRLQKGFSGGSPRALLYLMLHHALDLSFVETSIQLFANAGLINALELQSIRREPAFVQVTEASLSTAAVAGNSRWRHLYSREASITGNPQRTVGDFIPSVLTTMTATAYLKRQIDALEHLKDKPTAVLERVFAEHLDLCTYRLDAWYGGLFSYQLEALRQPQRTAQPDGDGDGANENTANTGIYLGAWGWLENVRPEFKSLSPVELPEELDEIFNDTEAQPPLTRDSSNQGYIHAPSLNHAVTAAVLRNGYLSNATPENPTSLAVNLSSERVRMALSIIEGLKADQNLGALLGYQFERGLHDRHDVEVDEFIYDLRKVFPLAGDRLKPTRTGPLDEGGKKIHIRKVEARNVIDGLELVEHLKTHSQLYPFGLDEELPDATPKQAEAISTEAKRLINIADAVADLAMAESVHQVTQGNYDRAGAVLDTYSKGKFPSTPDVIRTPRSGVTLTHRAALHLPVGLNPNDPARITPRSWAEPAIDAWLSSILPAPTQVACTVRITDPSDNSVVSHIVTQADLALAPIDLLYLLDPDNERSARSLDDRIEAFVIATHAPRPHTIADIVYRDRIPAIAGHVPFFELTALIRSLRTVLLRSRPLRPTDMAMAQESEETLDIDVSLDDVRITRNQTELTARRDALETFGNTLQALLDTEPQPTPQIITKIDQSIDTFATLMLALGPYAELDTGTGSVFADRRRIFTELLTGLEELLTRWNERLANFDQAIAEYDANPGEPNEIKFRSLLTAERFIATINTEPLPAQPDDFRNQLVATTRAAFVAERDALDTLASSASAISALHDGIETERPTIAGMDPEPLDLSGSVTAILALAEDMAARAINLSAEISTRLASLQLHLDNYAAEGDPRRQVEELTQAAKLLFGEDFQIVPDFALPTDQGNEWRTAWGAGATADQVMLDYQQTTLGRPFPVDDWFTGIARVREKMGAFEAITRYADAFTGVELPLQPLQFPYRSEVPWLALEFPETLSGGDPLVIDEDKLLYTAYYATPFDENNRQAGLLADEWTEVIPSRTEDTGLAFHYDRPNSEPPQSMLLALPAEYTGSWHWEDLVDCVRETMDLARKRAIEPDHIDTTAYARFLPAIVSAVTLHPITASLNFSFNNNLAAVLAAADGAANE